MVWAVERNDANRSSPNCRPAMVARKSLRGASGVTFSTAVQTASRQNATLSDGLTVSVDHSVT